MHYTASAARGDLQNISLGEIRLRRSPTVTLDNSDYTSNLRHLSFLRYFSTIQSSHPHSGGMQVDKLRVLITRERIAAKVAEMGQRISQDFAGEPVVLIGVLKGATIFLADLARQITLDVSFDFIAVSSYGNARQHSGEVKLVKDVDRSMEGRNIILVEDILDTGLTLTYIQSMLRAHRPKSLKIAALLDKVSRRIEPVQGDYVGFEIPDEFVVGYGLDFAEHYRNLPDICVLESDSETR
ncbi:MAG: hypoxanthine phosphoribosyltransferase [Candidatus Korobacteraceae bacterium]